MSRWTGRNIFVPECDAVPPGWYPYKVAPFHDYALPGRYCRERRWWWPIVVLFRIARAA